MAAAPPGGPSTVNGILYQLLWSLMTLGGFKASRHRLSEDRLEEITVILEPSTGGDQQSVSKGRRVVTQLKARTTGNTWSLQEVIRDVFSDLCLAVDLAQPDTEYLFVTEGRRGNWAKVESFFRNLSPLPAGEDLPGELSNTDEINFGRSQPAAGSETVPFWEPGPYSCRKLFCKIVDTLGLRTPFAEEPYETTCRKAWLLLRGFRFVGGQTHQSLREAVDEWLLARIGSADRLVERRDALLLDLARRACKGDAVITAGEFLSAHGLDATPLTDWLELTAKARNYLSGIWRRKRIDPSEDIRPSLAEEATEGWRQNAPILILTGESGCGKTWLGYEVLLGASDAGHISLLVDACGEANADMQEASNTFWYHIAEQDEALPLERLRARLRRLHPNNSTRQLVLFVDNVGDLDEIRKLVEFDWEALEMRVVITAPSSVAAAVLAQLGERGRVVNVPDFSLGELERYLSEVVAIHWESVPFDVKNTLRRPLLARVFREVVAATGWEPRNEYELFQGSWDRLRHKNVRLSDLDGLRGLALALLSEEKQYPWTTKDLRAAGLDSDAADRLLAAGWLRETPHEGYEVWHDRLLNWTIAEGVVHEISHSAESIEHHSQGVSNLFVKPPIRCGRILAYVPMDVLWLLSAPGRASSDLFQRMASACETAFGWRAPEMFLGNLLPTLGQRSTPFLLERLRTASESQPAYVLNYILDGLVATGDAQLPLRGIDLIGDPSPKIQRVGALLLKRRPIATALDRLWALHIHAVRTPEQFLREKEKTWSLYEDTFGALKSAVRLDPSWLERTINSSQVGEPVHDLAYLVSSLGDASLWSRVKEELKGKVSPTRERSIATCILKCRDSFERAWLEERVRVREDLLGPVALHALAIIDPHRALALLDQLEAGDLYLVRDWCFAELQRRLGGVVIAHFAQRLRQHDEPWRYALILQGQEDLIDPESFDFLLDWLDQRLKAMSGSDGRDPERYMPGCRTVVQFMNSVSRPVLLDQLRARRNRSLEVELTSWLLKVGPQKGGFHIPDIHDSLDALARIGGDGINQVLDDWLEGGDWYARMHAVKMAMRRATPKTIQLLARMTSIDEPAEEGQRMVLWGHAAAALGTHRCWKQVFAYYLRVETRCLIEVEECSPEPTTPLDDETLSDVLAEFRKEGGPSAGSVLAVALAGRTDLLPEIRFATRRTEPGSPLAMACLVALQWLKDKDSSMPATIARFLRTNTPDAVNALLVNDSPEAESVLVDELRGHNDLQLAVVLMNREKLRGTALECIHQVATASDCIRRDGGLVQIVPRLSAEAVRALADCSEVFSLAEEIAYGPDGPIRFSGEKPAALRLIGQRQPEAASKMAMARLRNPESADVELYPALLASLYPQEAESRLFEALLANPSTRVVRSIGRELDRMNAHQTLLTWLVDASPERRLAACRCAGMFRPTEDLFQTVRARMDDDNEIAKAAKEAIDDLESERIVEELKAGILAEPDETHRWSLLDALVLKGDPGEAGVPSSWVTAVFPSLSPAMRTCATKQLRERRKKQKEEFDSKDKRNQGPQ